MADDKTLEDGAPKDEARPYTRTVSDIAGLQPILTRAHERRKRMREQAIKSVAKAFPVQGKHFSMEVSDVSIDEKHFSMGDQKKLILEQGSLYEPIKGTLVIKDKDGKVVDKSRRTLAQMPWMTERHSFMIDGNEYGLANQLRIKPGVYTRTRNNGELESAFNLGRGKNFRMVMDPKKGIFKLGYDSTHINLYPVLRALNVSDTEIDTVWGKELAKVNREMAQRTGTAHVRKLYKKLVYPTKQIANATLKEMALAISEAYTRTILDPTGTRRTLGTSHSVVSPKTLIDTSRKLLKVYKGEMQEDDRDSLEFKTMHTPDTFVKERIEKDVTPTLQYKIKSKLNRAANPEISKILPPSPFTKSLKNLVTTSGLSFSPSQINPVEIIDMAGKVTSLGEGGIGSIRAVPDSTREQHNTHLGILDIVRTPESENVGIDVRSSVYAAVDAEGNPHALMRNVRTNKLEHVRVSKLQDSHVAFAGTNLKKGKVPVIKGNKVVDMASNKVDYMLPSSQAMFSPATGLVPMLDGMQGNRSIMGAKMQTQAVPLVNREAPHFQTSSDVGKRSMEGVLADWHLPFSRTAGTVTKIDKKAGLIHIQPEGGGKKKQVDFAHNFPFASKTGLTHALSVKVGDKVKKGQRLGDSNYTKNGVLALGTNLKTAYLAYHGDNTNDAVVISSGAAKKLTSEHMYKESVSFSDERKISKGLHRRYFGTKVNPQEYMGMTEDGLPKVGATIHPGQLIIAAVESKKMSADDALLGRLNKSLVKPYRDVSVTWTHGHPAEVVDVVKTGSQATVLLKTYEPMGIGDKLSGRFGNKGVVSRIIPDAQMPQDASGSPIDVMLPSSGVISRINPNQIIETAVSKVAVKTGKPIVADTMARHDRVKWAQKLLKDNGLKDKETVFDPMTGKKIPNIMVGSQYMFKLFKSTDTNFSTRGVGPYDSNEQPSRGGEGGAKAVGRMEFNALVAHGAKNIIRETATIKGGRNDEFWRRVQLGLPMSTPGTSFAFNKMGGMLTGAGINFKKNGNKFSMSPLTDRDIDQLAESAVTSPGVVKVRTTKNSVAVVPERNGLFDETITGGLRGTKWSKIDLAEPVVNPIFEQPARELLDMTEKAFNHSLYNDGAAALKRRLNALDTGALERKLNKSVRAKMKVATPLTMGSVDADVRKLKYLRSLRKEKLKPGDAYVLSKVPVAPPVMRPVSPGGNGQVLISDPNFLYKDLLMVNQSIRDTPAELRAIEDPSVARKELQGAVRAVFGTGDPVNDKTKARGAVGFITQMAGQGSPKASYFHNKLLTRQQDLAGRGTIAPDPSLGLDQIGIPSKMLWTQYAPFIVRRLVQKGYPVVTARQMVKDEHTTAKRELDLEIAARPLLVNRAPTLHRYGLIAAYAKPVHGKTIRLNPFAEEGMNADYDGDTVQLHVPVTSGAVNDAKDMTLSKQLFSDGTKNSLLVRPQHEAVIGAFIATGSSKGQVRKFKNKAAAMAAFHRNEITLNTPVVIGGQKTSLLP